MRKSSIAGERRSRGRSTDGSRSSLLQPGFASKHRRSSSAEHRDSGAAFTSRKSQVPIRRSRSQLALQPSVTPRRETISPCSSRSTPVDGLKLGSRSVTGTAQKPRRDIRDFSDKNVLSAAIAQICNYISQHDVAFNPRPPLSLKTFIDVTMFLLAEVGMPTDLTSANYTEVIPSVMRIMNYPGSLSVSWMKTAYAQHSLQHVVAMWSWLVEFTEATSSNSLFTEESYSEDFRILPAKEYFEMFSSAHFNWNAFKSKDEVIETFKDKLAEAFLPNYNESKEAALISEIAILTAKCEPENEVIKQKKELEEVLLQTNADINKLQTFLKNTRKFSTTLDKKIQDLETKRGETEGKLNHTQCITEKFRKQVASQELSVDDINELIQTCEHLRRRIKCGEKNISNLKEMTFELDREIVLTRVKFNEKLDSFNNLLVVESCSFPELFHLQIRSNVLAETFEEEIEEVRKALLTLHKDLSAARSETQQVMTNLQSQLDELTQSLSICYKDIESVTESSRLLEDRILNTKTRMNEEETKMREEEKYLKEEIEKTVNGHDFITLKQKLVAEKAKNDLWEVHIRKMQEKAMAFFKESVAITETFFTDVKNLRSQIEGRLKRTLEKKEAQRLKRK